MRTHSPPRSAECGASPFSYPLAASPKRGRGASTSLPLASHCHSAPRRAEGRLRPWPRGTVCRRVCSLCRGRCSTSTLWLRPTDQRAVVWELAVCRQRRARSSRQLPPGRRRWPSASAARAGRGGRRLLSPLQDGRAGCAAVRPRLQHVGLWRGTRMKERFAQGEPGAGGERVVMFFLCRLVTMFVTTTAPVRPVRWQGPQRPAAVEALVAPKVISA